MRRSAFALWERGELVRSISLSPDNGIIEDIGTPLAFEQPYWAGEHPVIYLEDEAEGDEPYPFAFYPEDFGNAAMFHFMGYQFDGSEPQDVRLLAFKAPGFLRRMWHRLAR